MVMNVETCPVGFLYSLNVNLTAVAGAVEDESRALNSSVASSVILASAILLASAVLLFAGGRLVKPTLFLAAFGISYVGGLFAIRELISAVDSMSSTVSCVLLGVTPLVVGLVGGLLAICLMRFGFALLGAAAGAGLGRLVYTAGLTAIKSPTIGAHQDLISILCLVLGAIVGAVFMLIFQHSLLIVATAAIGAAGATPALALLAAHADARFLTEANEPSSPFGWAQPVCFLVLFAAGLVIQCRCAKPKSETRPERHRLGTPLMSP